MPAVNTQNTSIKTKSLPSLPARTTLKIGGINEISAKLCLQDYFYFFAHFEEIFMIGANTAKILKARIMKSFFKEELIYDLRALLRGEKAMELSPDFFIKIFDIQEAEKDKDWDFYEQGILEVRNNDQKEWYKIYVLQIIPNLAIHITDLIIVLKNCGLAEEAEFFSLIEQKKRAKQEIGKLKTAKRDQKIIDQYQIIFKDKPSLSITDITKLIKNKLSLDLSERTIADVITKHHQQYIKDTWKKYLKQRKKRIKGIMLGIDYADANKNENGSLPQISMGQPNIFSYSSEKRIYCCNQDLIQNLWTEYQGKPTKKQVAKGLDNKVKKNIMSKLCIQPHKLDQMIEKLKN
jgi:hypothetical protein